MIGAPFARPEVTRPVVEPVETTDDVADARSVVAATAWPHPQAKRRVSRAGRGLGMRARSVPGAVCGDGVTASTGRWCQECERIGEPTGQALGSRDD